MHVGEQRVCAFFSSITKSISPQREEKFLSTQLNPRVIRYHAANFSAQNPIDVLIAEPIYLLF